MEPVNHANAGRNRYSIREKSKQLLFWKSRLDQKELIFFFLCLSFIRCFFFYFYCGNLPPSWTPSFGVYIWEFFLLHRTSKFSKFLESKSRRIFGNIQHPKAPTNHQFMRVCGMDFFSLKRQQHFRRFSKKRDHLFI